MVSSSFMAQKPKKTSLGVASSQCPQQPAATAEVARPWKNLMEFTMQNIYGKNRYRSDTWELEYVRKEYPSFRQLPSGKLT